MKRHKKIVTLLLASLCTLAGPVHAGTAADLRTFLAQQHETAALLPLGDKLTYVLPGHGIFGNDGALLMDSLYREAVRQGGVLEQIHAAGGRGDVSASWRPVWLDRDRHYFNATKGGDELFASEQLLYYRVTDEGDLRWPAPHRDYYSPLRLTGVYRAIMAVFVDSEAGSPVRGFTVLHDQPQRELSKGSSLDAIVQQDALPEQGGLERDGRLSALEREWPAGPWLPPRKLKLPDSVHMLAYVHALSRKNATIPQYRIAEPDAAAKQEGDVDQLTAYRYIVNGEYCTAGGRQCRFVPEPLRRWHAVVGGGSGSRYLFLHDGNGYRYQRL